ncbi:DUF1475 family protein [Clostridium estertheticum]
MDFMKIGKIFSFIGFLLMLVMLIYGFAIGNFTGEGKILLGMPWGQISLVDIYIEFIIVCSWIVYRENNIAKSLIWVLLVLTLGSMISCLYIFLSFNKSNGNWQKFWQKNRL